VAKNYVSLFRLGFQPIIFFWIGEDMTRGGFSKSYWLHFVSSE